MPDSTDSALAARLDALELRVRELEDERALRDLLTRYSFGADIFRGPQWVGLFTDDGSYDLRSENVDGAYSGRFTGPDDLLALITGPRDAPRRAGATLSRPDDVPPAPSS